MSATLYLDEVPRAPQNTAEDRDAVAGRDGMRRRVDACEHVVTSARAPRGQWACSRSYGHAGPHLAVNVAGVVVAEWERVTFCKED